MALPRDVDAAARRVAEVLFPEGDRREAGQEELCTFAQAILDAAGDSAREMLGEQRDGERYRSPALAAAEADAAALRPAPTPMPEGVGKRLAQLSAERLALIDQAVLAVLEGERVTFLSTAVARTLEGQGVVLAHVDFADALARLVRAGTVTIRHGFYWAARWGVEVAPPVEVGP